MTLLQLLESLWQKKIANLQTFINNSQEYVEML